MKTLKQYISEEFVAANRYGEMFRNPTKKELWDVIQSSKEDQGILGFRFMIDVTTEDVYVSPIQFLHGDMFVQLGWGSQAYTNYFKNADMSDVIITGAVNEQEYSFDTMLNDWDSFITEPQDKIKLYNNLTALLKGNTSKNGTLDFVAKHGLRPDQIKAGISKAIKHLQTKIRIDDLD